MTLGRRLPLAAGLACASGLSLALLSGCASVPDPMQREAAARAQTASAGLVWTVLPTERPLVAAMPAAPLPTGPTEHLTVYIEGDGLAWRAPDWPSEDPTPTRPLALQLALAHPGGGARAWLARPCQYVDAAHSGCPMALWTSARQGREALRLSHQALDLIKQRTGARTLTLVGHSGGGALAALLTSERTDVTHLVTVAANLDLAQWTSHHGLSPQRESYNPADRAHALENRSQLHLVGGQDRVVPEATARAFASHFPSVHRPPVEVVPPAEHEAGWVDAWRQRGAEWLGLDVKGSDR